MTQKNFSFAKKFSLPLYFVSAADGTNVVKVMTAQRQSAGSGLRSPGVAWRRGGGGGGRDRAWLSAAKDRAWEDRIW